MLYWAAADMARTLDLNLVHLDKTDYQEAHTPAAAESARVHAVLRKQDRIAAMRRFRDSEDVLGLLLYVNVRLA